MDISSDEDSVSLSTLGAGSCLINATAAHPFNSSQDSSHRRNCYSPFSRRHNHPSLPPWDPLRVKSLRRSSIGEVDDYREIRQIGAGGFGNCFLLERKKDQVLRVCKVQAREFYERKDSPGKPIEVKILQDILPPHDRIIRLHDYVLQPRTIQMYYDYCEGGDLHQLIGRYFDQWLDIPETFIWHAYIQLSEALAFLHSGYDRRRYGSLPLEWTSIIHGDIKDQNIFLRSPNPHSNDPLAREYPSFVLGDFGLADLEPSNRWSTLQWQPPELPVTSTKADVWCVGAVIHALAHEGQSPVSPLPPRNENLSWEQWCADPRARDPIPLHEMYSDELDHCVFNALVFNPDSRPNSYDLHFEVLGTWRDRVAPYCKSITPLIPESDEKWYDANGVTMATKARRNAIYQENTSFDTVEILISPEYHISDQHDDESSQHSPEKPLAQDWIPRPPPPEEMEDLQPPPPPPTAYEKSDPFDEAMVLDTVIDDLAIAAVIEAAHEAALISWEELINK